MVMANIQHQKMEMSVYLGWKGARNLRARHSAKCVIKIAQMLMAITGDISINHQNLQKKFIALKDVPNSKQLVLHAKGVLDIQILMPHC